MRKRYLFLFVFFIFRKYDSYLPFYINIAIKMSICIFLTVFFVKKHIGFSNLISAIKFKYEKR